MGEGFGYKTAAEALPAPGVMQDIQAAIDHAAQASGGKVGIVGYCWGGLLTWRSACTLKGLSAAKLGRHLRRGREAQNGAGNGLFDGHRAA